MSSVTLCVVSLLTFRHLEAKHVTEDEFGELVGYDKSPLLPLLYAMSSASMGIQSIIFSKSVSLLLRAQLNGNNMLVHWQTYAFLGAFIFFATLWVNRLNHVRPPLPHFLISTPSAICNGPPFKTLLAHIPANWAGRSARRRRQARKRRVQYERLV